MTDELRKLAEAVANPDKWYPASVIWDALTDKGEEDPEADCAYIAAASPDVVLGLMDRIAVLEGWYATSNGQRNAAEAERDEAYNAVRRLAGALESIAYGDRGATTERSEKTAREALADPVVRRIVEGG